VISALRRGHRVASIVLALVVPPCFALALASRPTLPPPGEIPAALVSDPPAGALVEERADLWSPLAIRTRIYASGVIELAPQVDLEQPDVLVYWSPEAVRDRLPDGARWLGRLAGTSPRRFALPPDARGRAGSLHLYSLGHAQWLASAALEAR
jgi:hypothetical protein